ncbi:hypothetical protein TruAng_003063 [Truncatella angustata]|nr:hypothetical protein TruAng_003063 [Truncatella angustata]
MPEIDPLVLSYSHLKDSPRAQDALHTLRKVASLSSTPMNKIYWVGLNVNRGQKICLRLRYPADRNQFLPIEQVVDTMLHELSHIVHGPHDAKFHALWDQLRDEHEALMMKGYTGEGFLSEGHRLGGRPTISVPEARRLARVAAEKRRTLSAGSGQRLGGRPAQPGEDIRRVIANAVERRNQTLQGCANNTHNEDEIRAIADTATKSGFSTQAEEDAANEAAIAQALWELVQEDERVKYGESYQPVTARNPAGSARRWESPQESPEQEAACAKKIPPRPPPPVPDTRPALPMPSLDTGHVADSVPSSWTCQVCTLQNPLNYLCCDACGVERAEETSKELSQRTTKRQRTTTVDLTGSPERGTKPPTQPEMSNSTKAATLQPGSLFDENLASRSKTWTCSFCGRVRDWNLWTCDLCGKVKESS